MKSLLIPIAGKSTRFPNTRPKWMLTHPKSGYFMGIESIRGINLDFFDKIYFTFLYFDSIFFFKSALFELSTTIISISLSIELIQFSMTCSLL